MSPSGLSAGRFLGRITLPANDMMHSGLPLTLDMCCSAGGTSIEDLAEKYPEKILKIPIDVFEGITDDQVQHQSAEAASVWEYERYVLYALYEASAVSVGLLSMMCMCLVRTQENI